MHLSVRLQRSREAKFTVAEHEAVTLVLKNFQPGQVNSSGESLPADLKKTVIVAWRCTSKAHWPSGQKQ